MVSAPGPMIESTYSSVMTFCRILKTLRIVKTIVRIVRNMRIVRCAGACVRHPAPRL